MIWYREKGGATSGNHHVFLVRCFIGFSRWRPSKERQGCKVSSALSGATNGVRADKELRPVQQEGVAVDFLESRESTQE